MDKDDIIGGAAGFGGFGMGALSTGFDIGSNIYSARQAEENQRRDIKAKERFAKHKYRWQMTDMKKAGLNPILAAGASPGSGGAGGTASGAPGGTNFHQSSSARSLVAKQKDLLSEQTTAATESAANSAQDVKAKDIQNKRQERIDRILYPQTLMGDAALILDHSQSPASAAKAAANTAKAANNLLKAKAAKKAAAEAAEKAAKYRALKASQNRRNARQRHRNRNNQGK